MSPVPRIWILLWGVWVSGALVALNCDGRKRHEEAQGRLDRIEQRCATKGGSALLEDLDRIEARLVASSARAREWEELARRREEATPVACAPLRLHDEGQRDTRLWALKKTPPTSTPGPGVPMRKPLW